MPINYGDNDVTTTGKIKQKILSLTPQTVTLDAKTKNDWDLSGSSFIICNLDTSTITTYLSVTGIVAGEDGEIKILLTTDSTKYITLYHENSSSSANNRIYCPENNNFRSSKRSGIILIYSTTSNRWHIMGETGVGGTGWPSVSVGSVGGGGP